MLPKIHLEKIELNSFKFDKNLNVRIVYITFLLCRRRFNLPTNFHIRQYINDEMMCMNGKMNAKMSVKEGSGYQSTKNINAKL